MTLEEIYKEIDHVKDHLDWAIATSKNKVTFGMLDKKESCFFREIRLRGSAGEALKLLRSIEKHLKEQE